MFVTVCHFDHVDIFFSWSRRDEGVRRSLGLFYCLILCGAEATAHLTRYGGEAQVIRGEVHTHCACRGSARSRYRYKERKYRSGTKDGEKTIRCQSKI
jgi:hypothetical protein